jgi:hypothetical protein
MGLSPLHPTGIHIFWFLIRFVDDVCNVVLLLIQQQQKMSKYTHAAMAYQMHFAVPSNPLCVPND